MAAHSSILPGKFHGQRSLAGCSLRGRRVGLTERLSTHTLANSGGLIQPLPAWALTRPTRGGQGLLSTTDDPRLSKVSQPVKRRRTQVSWLPGRGMAPALAVSVPLCAHRPGPWHSLGAGSGRVWAGPGGRRRTQGTESRSRSWRPALNRCPSPAGWRREGPRGSRRRLGRGHWPPGPGPGGGAGPGVGLLRSGGCGGAGEGRP